MHLIVVNIQINNEIYQLPHEGTILYSCGTIYFQFHKVSPED